MLARRLRSRHRAAVETCMNLAPCVARRSRPWRVPAAALGLALVLFLGSAGFAHAGEHAAAEPAAGDLAAADPAQSDDLPPPNILFVAIDDLNDWIEPLGGHPQAKTPNMNALADRAALFTRAYAASPACNPSRSALLTGRHTYSTGMYSNYQRWRDVLVDPVFLPDYFRQHGYWTGGAGKIFHNGQPSPESWDDYYPSKEEPFPAYFYPAPGATVNMPAFPNMYRDFDWAPLDLPTEKTGDFQSVAWALRQLERSWDKPFFLAVGIYRPHVPWYAPSKYFDMHPLDQVALPVTMPDDLADVPDRGVDLARRGGDYHRHIVAAGKWREAVQAYLASVTYADDLLGRLLKGLEASSHANNTIVVVWSDHGWQLGEKEHWRKFALWENVARVPLFIYAPAGASAALPEGTRAARIDRPVSLIDLFPTLTTLAGLPGRAGLDGSSLTLLMASAEAEWNRPAITTYDYDEYAVRDDRYRYIHYIDGAEELYDEAEDPEEWRNLAGDPAYKDVKARLKAAFPATPAPMGPTIALMPHHVPPFGSLDQYREYKRQRAPEPTD
ncbi:MAG: sulfatase-like hydrolase/transferase [Alphaproteobacteria bacterium]|nr:sulfatase-like hydrolase/transferase [Alphaproteobacteria bacterium]